MTRIPKSVREVVYARDGFRCRWCGRTNVPIHLHHVVYRSGGGEHVPENLVSLCVDHHAEAHSNKGEYQDLLLDLLQGESNVTVLQLMRWKQTDSQTPVSQHGPVGRLLDLD